MRVHRILIFLPTISKYAGVRVRIVAFTNRHKWYNFKSKNKKMSHHYFSNIIFNNIRFYLYRHTYKPSGVYSPTLIVFTLSIKYSNTILILSDYQLINSGEHTFCSYRIDEEYRINRRVRVVDIIFLTFIPVVRRV